MRKSMFAGLVLAGLFGIGGQASASGMAPDRSAIGFEALDLASIAAEDERNDRKGEAFRFAIARAVAVNPTADGLWSSRADGSRQWQFDVHTPDAVHLNFGFNPFQLPAGASLRIVSRDGKQVLGPFTERDNNPSAQLWTPILPVAEARVELVVPAGKEGEVKLGLVHIGQGYRGFGATAKYCRSGACNMDVACLGNNDSWNQPRRSVAAYSRNGSFACTGSLLNNTANDRRMLFATATHCGVSSDSVAATLVAYWNYESASCRTPGSQASGTSVPRPTTTSTGARFLAQTGSPFNAQIGSAFNSDFTLVEFLQPANPAHNLYWAGWDRRDRSHTCTAPANLVSTEGLCASIHHPGVQEKRITFVEQTMEVSNFSGGQNSHLHPYWDPTPPLLPGITPAPTTVVPNVTEPGSSGSPLYSADKRFVGVLSGGPSQCGSTGGDLSDFYGRLSNAWEGGGTPATAVKSHLDPVTGGAAEFLDGVSQCTLPAAPTDVAAAVDGANRVAVTWTAVPGITRYRILRSTGACPGATFVPVGDVENATRFVDTTVSGGTTYSYKVTSYDTTQPCESVLSQCSNAVATGVCTLAPAFTGLGAATNAHTATCAAQLSWASATPSCGAAGQMRYNVFRSTSANFTPSADNLIRSCVTDTQVTDTTVANATRYYYAVRAEDISGSGNGLCASGLQDTNTQRLDVRPTGPDIVAFGDDVEGAASWVTAGTGPANGGFSVVTDHVHSPTRAWHSPDPGEVQDRTLTQITPVTVPAEGGVLLEFWHRYELETAYDGAVLEYSLDGGTTWTDILAAQGPVPANANRLIEGGYNGALNSAGAFPGRNAWHGAHLEWSRVQADLADFAGRIVKLRFRTGSDNSVGRDGWWIDDVRLFYGSSCSVGADLIFRNGFEP
ncbi:fibronectin type III domain-containing protein [Tahibacter amnicola]|uniref:SURP motif domain-containing protein n=1 Tax=Tahibacter amnicola TaxID=2976241 RepID=A0ABY6BCT5_9GAMM|nr:hypothetical protein [Tahibacter amnicola]UXI67853.1 hypothetical protein N4264_24495 [Tahibacter amnicola]